MPDQLQLRGGTTTEHNSFTGAAREVTVDTTKKTVVVHDGSQAGGTPLMKESGANAASSVGIGTGGTNALNIDSSQRVGIGITNPTSTLHLDASSGAVLQLQRTSSNASNKISLSHDGTNGTLDSTNATLFRNGGGEKMRIDSSGRMLLGTTTEGHPDADDFTIERASGYVGITLRSATDQGGAIYFSDATSGTGEYDGQIIYSQASRKMQFGAGNGIRLELEDGFSKFAGGRILLGTSTEGHPDADDLTLESASGYTGITLRAANTAGGAIYFSDATTGTGEYSGQILYSHASNVMTFGVSSSERMRIGSTGNVSIGSTSNVAPLNVKAETDGNLHVRPIGSVASAPAGSGVALDVLNDANNAVKDLALRGSTTIFRNASTESMRIDSSGKLLVGSSGADTGGVVIDKNITAESDPSDTANYHLVIRSQSNSNTSKIGIAFKNTSSSTHVGAAILHHRTAGGSIGDLAFYTSPSEGNTTERTKITSAGTLLHGSGAIASQKATNGGLDIACNNNSIIFGADSNSGVTTQARTNNTPKDQRIAAVHYTNAEEPIGVVRVYSDSTANQMHFGGGSSLFNAATTMYFYTAANNTTTSGTERMRINSAGSVSIGTSTNANARLFINPRVDGTTQRGIVVSGRKDVYDVIAINFVHAVNNSSAGSIQFTSTAAVQYNTTSDYRLKQDVVTLTDSITRLKLLNPVHFKWKDSPSVETDGFLAHEVQTVIPSAITGEKDALDKDGNIEPQQIDTSKLTPLLTSALQEAVTKIEVLETKVAALEAA